MECLEFEKNKAINIWYTSSGIVTDAEDKLRVTGGKGGRNKVGDWN